MSNISSIFQLSGLHCESCKKITEKRVGKIAGVASATTDLSSGELTVLGERVIPKSEIESALNGLDYTVN